MRTPPLPAGLQLILSAELDEYLDDVPESPGMRVALHRARTRPPVEEQGFTVPPRAASAVSINMVRSEGGRGGCTWVGELVKDGCSV